MNIDGVLLHILSIQDKERFSQGRHLIGIAWLLISIVLYLMIFIVGPLKMPLWDYATDIAVTYLMIPTITTGFGYLMEHRAEKIWINN
jgi:hypothetical protein